MGTLQHLQTSFSIIKTAVNRPAAENSSKCNSTAVNNDWCNTTTQVHQYSSTKCTMACWCRSWPSITAAECSALVSWHSVQQL